MKRIIYFAAMLAAAVSAASCEQEKLATDPAEEATVTFAVSVPQDAVTKAYGDGQFSKKEVIIGVFDETGVEKFRKTYTWEPTEFTKEVQLTFAMGKSYQMVFWAQYGNAYGEPGTMPLDKITMPYTASNMEDMDAFYAYVPVFKVSGDFTKDVVMKRPFAQLNFATTPGDIKEAVDAGIVPADGKPVTVTISNAANTLDLFTGETSFVTADAVAESGEVVIPATAFPTDAEGKYIPIKIEGRDYEVVAMNYVLVADKNAVDGKTTSDLTIKVGEVELTVPGANMKRNYKTNVAGEFLTGEGTFTVTIDPIFGGEYTYDINAITFAQLQKYVDGGFAGTYHVEGVVTASVAVADKTGYESVTIKDADGATGTYVLKVPAAKSDDAAEGSGDSTEGSEGAVTPAATYYNAGDTVIVAVVVAENASGSFEAVADETPYAHYPSK